jgi:hypothetical protein
MKHIHHIIPKHMGGSNDPSNLIKLTVAEHAEAHRKRFSESMKISWAKRHQLKLQLGVD